MIKATCRRRSVGAISDQRVVARLKASIRTDGEDLEDLDLGAVYDVWALEHRDDGGLWIYIEAPPSHAFPTPFPVEFFELVEATPPEGWTLSLGFGPDGVLIRRISFPAWALRDAFYEDLVAGEPAAVAEFRKQRARTSS